MGFFDFLNLGNKSKENFEIKEKPESDISQPVPRSYLASSAYENYPSTRNVIFQQAFDGEKTPGELGHVYDLQPEYLKLRMRAYELDLKTDIVKIITGKFFKWVIGTGLKLQCEADETVLNMLNYETSNLEDFKKRSEHLFNLYAKSKFSDYSRQSNLHAKGNEAFKTAFLGGDALCILRNEGAGVNVQVIDGEQVCTPLDDEGKLKNTKIKHGIEYDKKGRHVAFWVKNSDDLSISSVRIKAYDSNGFERAWMIYGDKHRIDHLRGIPKITSILEKVTKLDRFVEASVSKAEQIANVPYSIEHEHFSDGENPLNSLGPKKSNKLEAEETTYEQAGRTANQIRQTTPNSVFNMPIGAKLKAIANEGESSFDDFYKAVFRSLCAAIDVPPEVAVQMYEQSYSSSRAAINMWEHIIEIYREYIVIENFYKPFYKFWLYNEILQGRIESQGLEKAITEKDTMALESLFNCRFTGKKMPHIDPLKEAKAIREMLQDKTPLISREQATEMANGGDWNSNYNKFKSESQIVDPELQNHGKDSLEEKEKNTKEQR